MKSDDNGFNVFILFLCFLFFFFFWYALTRCTQIFRFAKEDLERLRTCLHLPIAMRGANRSSWSGLEGLCVVLRRLAYPNRRFDLESIFGRGEAELSVIFNTTLGFLYNEWNGLITDIARQKQGWLSAERIAESCAAVRRVCPLDHVWGFIDGTAIPIAHPNCTSVCGTPDTNDDLL